MTDELILKTREHFAALHRSCIEKAVSGEYRVNDLPAYILSNEDNIASTLAGANDHTFTFRQYMHYLETGNSIPLLS